METLSDFGTVSYFGVSTFTTGIYNYWFIFDNLKMANFLSLILLFFVLILFAIENSMRKNSRFHSLKNDGRKQKIYLSGYKGCMAFLFCFGLLSISFILPFFQMIYWSLKFPEYYESLNILELNINTFLLIFCTASILILIALITNFEIEF